MCKTHHWRKFMTITLVNGEQFLGNFQLGVFLKHRPFHNVKCDVIMGNAISTPEGKTNPRYMWLITTS